MNMALPFDSWQRKWEDVEKMTLNHIYSARVYFHFFIPEGKEDRVSYYKLKVLFPHSNIEILGQKEVEEKLKIGTSVGEYAGPSLNEIAPFVIPRIHKSLSRFIYVSPDIIVKGRIEELFGIDLNNYAIAAAEDCTKKLSTYVNFDVLDAIQRSASKPWVSGIPYEKNVCTPVLSVLLIDARKLENDLVEAVLWWSKVLNRNERSSQSNPAVVLALYNRYLKLPTSWMVGDSTPSKTNNDSRILRFDGYKNVCSELGSWGNPESDLGSLWKKYLPPLADRILGS